MLPDFLCKGIVNFPSLPEVINIPCTDNRTFVNHYLFERETVSHSSQQYINKNKIIFKTGLVSSMKLFTVTKPLLYYHSQFNILLTVYVFVSNTVYVRTKVINLGI